MTLTYAMEALLPTQISSCTYDMKASLPTQISSGAKYNETFLEWKYI